MRLHACLGGISVDLAFQQEQNAQIVTKTRGHEHWVGDSTIGLLRVVMNHSTAADLAFEREGREHTQPGSGLDSDC